MGICGGTSHGEALCPLFPDFVKVLVFVEDGKPENPERNL